MAWTTYDSPLGPLTLISATAGLQAVHFPGHRPSLAPSDRDPTVLHEAVSQLEQYFNGERRTFSLELDLSGTTFQRRVWRALQQVPYGRTTTYGGLARELNVNGSGSVSAAREVAWATAATPTPIVVACHRVIAADGSLTGYRGGLQRKQALLDFEASGGTPDALRGNYASVTAAVSSDSQTRMVAH
ncbi:MAG: methylated-DNA--[protein]-cysteine S-methyltransferase [Solirubrobacteraceae bacterium]